jgi:exosortase A
MLFFEPLISAARIWYISEIFQHGFFIIPGAIYFMWQERRKLAGLHPSPNYWVLALVIPFLVLAVFGYAGRIQVFQHVAAFTILPLMIWFLVGNQIAKVIWFPLCFILFSIPIGEELVPSLQKVTADMAVALLNLTSIPSYNSGLYIEIPEGKFVVAEACSGIRFFVGSIVFGAVYSHISYHAFSRKLIFMALAIVVPVLANAVRVFSIVLIGHYVDMEYASGVDHLVYGWVFFAIVLFLLVLFGETFRDRKAIQEAAEEQDQVCVAQEGGEGRNWDLEAVSYSFSLILLLTGAIWQYGVISGGDVYLSALDRAKLNLVSTEQSLSSSWSPKLTGAGDYYSSILIESNADSVAMVVGWYPENSEGKELISSSNQLFDKERWSPVSNSVHKVSSTDKDFYASVLEIVSARGEHRLVLSWYQFEGKTYSSKLKAKLYQAFDIMVSGDGAGAIVVLSADFSRADRGDKLHQLLDLAGKNAEKLRSAMPFK